MTHLLCVNIVAPLVQGKAHKSSSLEINDLLAPARCIERGFLSDLSFYK